VTQAQLLVQGDPARPVARLVGDIDLTNVDDLAATFARTVENTALGLVVDLTAVTYLDSTGLRLLFRLARALEDRQQDLRLVLPHASPLRRVLTLAGVGVGTTVAVLCSYAPDDPDRGCPHG
jgi:anti-anti-sigma factor